MREAESIFERIEQQITEVREVEDANVGQVKNLLARQAEVIAYLVGRVKDLEARVQVEEKWDGDVEEILRLMALDDSHLWRFRKHKEAYEEIARKGVAAAGSGV